MKRYWVNVTIEISEYDEQQKSIKHVPEITETFTNLTPEPGQFIVEILSGKGQRIEKMLGGTE